MFLSEFMVDWEVEEKYKLEVCLGLMYGKLAFHGGYFLKKEKQFFKGR